jgi:chromosome segregation ATPase
MVKEKSSEEINNRIKQDESFINYLNERMKEKPEEAEQLKNMIEDTKKHLEKYKAKKSELSKIDDLRKRSGVDNNLYEVEIPDPIEKDTPT